jgi:excisionase family DNA binding protein
VQLANRNDLVSLGVAAKMLRLSHRTLRRMVEDGRIAATNITTGTQPRWRVSLADVERLRAERTP